jgi:hypothetical protein
MDAGQDPPAPFVDTPVLDVDLQGAFLTAKLENVHRIS